MTKDQEIEAAWATHTGLKVHVKPEVKLGKTIFADRAAIEKCWQDYLARARMAKAAKKVKQAVDTLSDGVYHNLGDLKNALQRKAA